MASRNATAGTMSIRRQRAVQDAIGFLVVNEEYRFRSSLRQPIFIFIFRFLWGFLLLLFNFFFFRIRRILLCPHRNEAVKGEKEE